MTTADRPMRTPSSAPWVMVLFRMPGVVGGDQADRTGQDAITLQIAGLGDWGGLGFDQQAVARRRAAEETQDSFSVKPANWVASKKAQALSAFLIKVLMVCGVLGGRP